MGDHAVQSIYPPKFRESGFTYSTIEITDLHDRLIMHLEKSTKTHENYTFHYGKV